MTDKKIIAWALISSTNVNEFGKEVDAAMRRGMLPYGAIDVAVIDTTPLYTMTLYSYEEIEPITNA